MSRASPPSDLEELSLPLEANILVQPLIKPLRSLKFKSDQSASPRKAHAQGQALKDVVKALARLIGTCTELLIGKSLSHCSHSFLSCSLGCIFQGNLEVVRKLDGNASLYQKCERKGKACSISLLAWTQAGKAHGGGAGGRRPSPKHMAKASSLWGRAESNVSKHGEQQHFHGHPPVFVGLALSLGRAGGLQVLGLVPSLAAGRAHVWEEREKGQGPAGTSAGLRMEPEVCRTLELQECTDSE